MSQTCPEQLVLLILHLNAIVKTEHSFQSVFSIFRNEIMTSMINSKQPSTEPRGTPLFILTEVLLTLSVLCTVLSAFCQTNIQNVNQFWAKTSESRQIGVFRFFRFYVTNISTGWAGVSSLKNPAEVCRPPSSAQHPLISRCWTWVITTCWIQVWRNLLMAWRVYTANWRFSSKCALHLLYICIHDMYIRELSRAANVLWK